MQDLTERQKEILALLEECIAETGMPPTRAEIANKLGFRSQNAAEQHLKALVRKGYVELLPGASRGIRLLRELPPKRQYHGLPIIGQVAAGQPILAQQHIEDYSRLPPEDFRPRADYLLRVKGMSMRDAGILDGDLLAVHQVEQARNGQIVVARVDDEVTVKRFRQQGHIVQLLPANPDFRPLEINLQEQALVIEGLGVGVIRYGLE
jgi:repressor LexA